MELLRSGPVRLVIAGVILVVAIALFRRVWKWFAEAGDRRIEAELRQALGEGDLKKAGELQLSRGLVLEASRIFQRGGEHALAADCLMKLGDEKGAVEEFEKAGDHSRAGALHKKLGNMLRAGASFERCKSREDRLLGAECLAKADEHLRAGRLFQDCEEFEKAADCFAKVEDLDSLDVALTMLENAALAKTTDPAKKRVLWGRAGELAVKLGAHERAARAFDEADQKRRAAQIYETALKKYAIAAAIYADVGDSQAEERNASAAGNPLAVVEARLARARARGDKDLIQDLENAARKHGSATAATVVAGTAKEKEATGVATVIAQGSKGSGGGGGGRSPTPDHSGDRFDLLGELGRGGMGVVYKAKDLRLGRFVALKFLPADVEPDSTLMRLFHREARAAAALSHPGIVTIYDSGQMDGKEFIAMELVEGKTLDRVLDDEGPLPIAEAMDVMEKVLVAMEYAHGKSVIHRDLKPANLMRTKMGIKVMDFGLAKTVNTKSSGGQTVIGGTPSYMPPEQKTGQTDHRSDVFALGATFYELISGVLPGHPGEPASVSTSYPTLRERDARVPPRLSELIARCLEHDRMHRPQDVVSLLRELREIKAEPLPTPSKRRDQSGRIELPKATKAQAPEPEPKKRAPLPRIAREEEDTAPPVAPRSPQRNEPQPDPKKRAPLPRLSREDDDGDAPPRVERIERVDRIGQARKPR